MYELKIQHEFLEKLSPDGKKWLARAMEGALVVDKILMVSIVCLGLYAAIRLEWKLKERWAKVILIIGIIMTALACLSFVFTLT